MPWKWPLELVNLVWVNLGLDSFLLGLHIPLLWQGFYDDILPGINVSSDFVSLILKISGRPLPPLHGYVSINLCDAMEKEESVMCIPAMSMQVLPSPLVSSESSFMSGTWEEMMTLLEQLSSSSWLPVTDVLMVYKWINNLDDYPSTLPLGMHYCVTVFIALFTWGPSDFYSDLLLKTIIASILLPIVKYQHVTYIILKS